MLLNTSVKAAIDGVEKSGIGGSGMKGARIFFTALVEPNTFFVTAAQKPA